MPWIKRTNEEFKEGMKFRLGGTEGKIENLGDEENWDYVSFGWDTDNVEIKIDRFPDLEIWVEEPKISREAGKELLDFIYGECPSLGHPSGEYLSYTKVKEKINSMIQDDHEGN